MKSTLYCIAQTSYLTRDKTDSYNMKFLIYSIKNNQYFIIHLEDENGNSLDEIFQLTNNEYYIVDCTEFMTSLNPENKKSKRIKHKLYSITDPDNTDNKVFETNGSFIMQ